MKRLSVNGKVGQVAEAIQAELVFALRAKSATVQLPSVKKFLVAVKPANAPDAVMVPVDVDDLAKIPAKAQAAESRGRRDRHRTIP